MTSKERARLKGLASTADTIVQIGKSGITENVVASGICGRSPDRAGAGEGKSPGEQHADCTGSL